MSPQLRLGDIKMPQYNEILLKVMLNTINLKNLNLSMSGQDSGRQGVIRVVIISSGPDSGLLGL